jgi:hypothetical protein
MTVATLRADAWPQATTGGYAKKGLMLYFLYGKGSERAINLRRDTARADHVTDAKAGRRCGFHSRAIPNRSRRLNCQC